MKLGDVCDIKMNFPEADFWIINRGADIGKVSKTFDAGHVGVKVTNTEVLVPQYLYYVMEYNQIRGVYRDMTVIRPSLLKEVELQPTE